MNKFFLGKNDVKEEFFIYENEDIFEGEFYLYIENGDHYLVGILKSVYEDEIIIMIHENVYDERIHHRFQLIDDLDQFLNRAFGINLTEELKNYILTQKIMKKLTD